MPPIIQIDRPPKGIPKEAWAKFKSENFWNVAKVAVRGEDAYIVMTGSGMKRRVFAIPNYKETTELAINAAISEGVAYDGAYPLGRNFQDCLGWLCQHGMRSGYIQPIKGANKIKGYKKENGKSTAARPCLPAE